MAFFCHHGDPRSYLWMGLLARRSNLGGRGLLATYMASLKLNIEVQRHPAEPARAGGLVGSAAAEERDSYHQDAHTNDRNHASGAPRPGRE